MKAASNFSLAYSLIASQTYALWHISCLAQTLLSSHSAHVQKWQVYCVEPIREEHENVWQTVSAYKRGAMILIVCINQREQAWSSVGLQDPKVTKYMSVQARGDLEGYTFQRPVSRTNLSTQLHWRNCMFVSVCLYIRLFWLVW